MPVSFLVQVPLDQAGDLDELMLSLDQESSITTAHPFDGETVAQVLITVGTVSFPFFRIWIKTRAAERKVFKVVIDGVELTGYTADEAQAILEQVQGELDKLNES